MVGEILKAIKRLITKKTHVVGRAVRKLFIIIDAPR